MVAPERHMQALIFVEYVEKLGSTILMDNSWLIPCPLFSSPYFRDVSPIKTETVPLTRHGLNV